MRGLVALVAWPLAALAPAPAAALRERAGAPEPPSSPFATLDDEEPPRLPCAKDAGEDCGEAERPLPKEWEKWNSTLEALGLVDGPLPLARGHASQPPAQNGSFAHIYGPLGRIGSWTLRMLVGKAIAQHYGLRYVGARQWGRVYGYDRSLLQLLGLPELLPKSFTGQEVTHWAHMVPPPDFDKLGQWAVKEEVREGLRKDLVLPPERLWSQTAPLRVAVHVRRGDAAIINLKNRIMPNSYYLEVIRQIRRMEPRAEIAVFSNRNFSGGRGPGWEPGDFEREGCAMRMGGSLGEAWAHMIEADVFVTSHSDFSQTPAMLARGLVVYAAYMPGFPFWHSSLPDFLVTDGTAEGVAGDSWLQGLQASLKTKQRLA